MKILVIAPHNDDEVLWNTNVLYKFKPLVFICTISRRQGDNALPRLRESFEGCKFLGCPMITSGIYDDELTEDNLTEILKHFVADDLLVYAPALEGGHPDHDLVHKVVKKLFTNVRYYKTYHKNGILAEKTTSQAFEQPPREIKEQALKIYKTQIERKSTSYFFLNIDKEYYE